MSALTPRQRQCLDIIEGGIARNGVSPSYDEIAAAMGLASRGRICMLVDGLESRGAVRRVPGCPRALTVVKPGEATDAIAFLDPDTRAAVRAYARRQSVSIEAGLAEVARKFFMGVSA